MYYMKFYQLVCLSVSTQVVCMSVVVSYLLSYASPVKVVVAQLFSESKTRQLHAAMHTFLRT